MIRKLKYLFDSIKQYINKTSSKYDKSRLLVFLDMLWCAIRYSASPANYFLPG